MSSCTHVCPYSRFLKENHTWCSQCTCRMSPNTCMTTHAAGPAPCPHSPPPSLISTMAAVRPERPAGPAARLVASTTRVTHLVSNYCVNDMQLGIWGGGEAGMFEREVPTHAVYRCSRRLQPDRLGRNTDVNTSSTEHTHNTCM